LSITGFRENIDRTPEWLNLENIMISRMLVWADINAGKLMQIMLVTQAVISCDPSVAKACGLDKPYLADLNYVDVAARINNTSEAFFRKKVVEEQGVSMIQIPFTMGDIAFSDSWLSINDLASIESYSPDQKIFELKAGKKPSDILLEIRNKLTPLGASTLEVLFVQAVKIPVFTMRSMLLRNIKVQEFNASSRLGMIEQEVGLSEGE
jgi:hypothetical protein